MASAHTSIDELGDGYGFRKVRQLLGVTAFGVNVIVIPPGGAGVHHYHDEQYEIVGADVRRLTWGRRLDVDEPAGTELDRLAVDIETSLPLVDEIELVLLVVGGKDGYVGRDGQLVDPADLPKRQAISRGDFGV